MKFSTNRYLFNFAKCITSALILLASASSSSAQFFPSFPQPATEQSGITSQGAFNIAQVPNSEYGTAVLAVFASHQGNNDLGYALMPDGVTAAWSDFNVDLPGVRCSNISTCAAGIAVYNGVIYIAYADFSGTGIDVVTATPVAGTSRYSWSLVHQDTSVNPTTAPGLAVVNGQLIIVFGASNDSSQSNAFYSISLNGTTWSQASEQYLGGSAYRVASGQQPGLAILNGTLYMGLQGNNSNHYLTIYSSTDGTVWTETALVTSIQFNSGLSMVSCAGNLVAVARQNANGSAMYVFSSPNGANWTFQRYPGIVVGATPSVAIFNSDVALAIKSNDPTGTLFTDVAPQ